MYSCLQQIEFGQPFSKFQSTFYCILKIRRFGHHLYQQRQNSCLLSIVQAIETNEVTDFDTIC